MAYRVLAKWPQPGACPHLLTCRAWSPKTKETIPTWLLCRKTVQDGRTSRNNPIKRGKGQKVNAPSDVAKLIIRDSCCIYTCLEVQSVGASQLESCVSVLFPVIKPLSQNFLFSFLICSSIASIPQLPELQPQLALQKSVSNLQKPSPVANQEVCVCFLLISTIMKIVFKLLSLIWSSRSTP